MKLGIISWSVPLALVTKNTNNGQNPKAPANQRHKIVLFATVPRDNDDSKARRS
jgi:hypothetical protein